MATEDFDIDKIAKLARIDLREEEHNFFKKQFETLLGYFGKIQQLNVDAVEATAHALPVYNVWREDRATATLSPAEVFRNAPAQRDQQLIVPKVID
jgi:aspartyl-tRNA(Asn)/glutamyl-tRNA(Gln) amidotransferase subunit C